MCIWLHRAHPHLKLKQMFFRQSKILPPSLFLLSKKQRRSSRELEKEQGVYVCVCVCLCVHAYGRNSKILKKQTTMFCYLKIFMRLCTYIHLLGLLLLYVHVTCYHPMPAAAAATM